MRAFAAFATLTTVLVVSACSSSDPGPAMAAAGGTAGAGGAGGATSTGGVAPVTSGGTPSTGGGGGVIIPSNGGLGSIPETPGNSRCGDGDISVLFLIDRSGSMNCNLPPLTASAECEAMSPPAKVDETAKSKWEVVSEVLGASLDLLVTTDPDIKVRAAVTYFSVDGNCGATSTPAVPMEAVSEAHLTAIRDSVAAQEPKGGTPIVGGSVLAYKYLHQTLNVKGNAHVVLITDGADSCDGYYDANPAIGPGDHVANLISVETPKAAGFGIKTWVIGAPGSEPARATLSNLAIAGTTRRTDDCAPGSTTDATVGDCHYDMTTTSDFAVALEEALKHIMEVVTCQTPR